LVFHFIPSDIRLDAQVKGKSINLALSTRGLAALEAAGVDKDILKGMIPMKGRMIHSLTGKEASQPYGSFGEVKS